MGAAVFVSDTSRHRLQIDQKESIMVDADWIEIR